MWEKAAKTRKTNESSTPNQTTTASSVVHLESNLQMVLWQEPESTGETSTPHVEVEDDESIDEDDERMQADLEALEHDPGKRIPISMYVVNDQVIRPKCITILYRNSPLFIDIFHVMMLFLCCFGLFYTVCNFPVPKQQTQDSAEKSGH